MCSFEHHIPLLEKGLRQVKERTAAEWEPAHIIEMCRSKTAFLFVVDEGFFILRPIAKTDTHPLRVECVAAYSDHAPSSESLIIKYMPLVDELAHDIGATRLLFDSPRRGFERLPGVQISTVKYEKEICCG